MHLYPWHRISVFAIIAFTLIATVQRASAQDLQDLNDSPDCRSITLRVYDSTGMAVPDALVVVANMWTIPTNYDGVASIRCKPGLRLPVSVEVTARGYKPAMHMVANSGLGGDTDIYLEREKTTLPASATVSARELTPDAQKDSSALQHEAMQALERGDNADAEQLFRRALEMTPSSGSIYNNIGVSYLRRGNIEEAAAWFEKAVKISPYDPQLLGNLGMMRWIQHRPEEAYQSLDRAVGGGFSSPGAYYILGVVSLWKGRPEQAIKQLRQTDASKYPMRDLYLSVALNLEGKAKAALKTYESYVANNHVPFYLAYLPHSIDGK